jgi:hypothetical protein
MACETNDLTMRWSELRKDSESLILFSLDLMRAALLLAVVCSVDSAFAAGPRSSTSRPSPDGRWRVAWHCAGTWQADSCNIAVSRLSDGKVFFTHHTSDRYIAAVWSADSKMCILLDAPDNTNSYLWLFRVQGRDIATEKLDYEKIGHDIEAAVPAARRQEPGVTRGGFEKIVWSSARELRLHITYNNVPVLVAVDVGEPKIRVLSHNET